MVSDILHGGMRTTVRQDNLDTIINMEQCICKWTFIPMQNIRNRECSSSFRNCASL